jgi:serine/threonine protein kinase
MHIDFIPGGYRLRGPVQESTTTVVYRAERERDGRAVILKVLKREAATPGALARYRHEHEVLESVRIPGVVEVLGMEMVQGLPMLVLEDFGAGSLARLHREQRFDPGLGLARVLDIAARLADILGEVHDRGVIHRDVNPANVLLDPDTGAVKLAGFGSSRRSTSEPTVLGGTAALVGTRAYMAPEQTGRMNRPVDHRADLYSLGVTLYELCTGRLPFYTGGALEPVHSHLARHPVPAHELDPAVPEAISDIVARLMARMPEERYQSAGDCAHDLRTCQGELEAVLASQSARTAQLAQTSQLSGPTGYPPASPGHGGGLRVLLVEDNQVSLRITVRMLAKDGHSCAVAGDGAEALRMFESEPFDVVLMDLLMPVMDGYTATREIRRREQGTGSHIPIIAYTASLATAAECADEGMDHFLSKPLRIDAIRELLQRIRSKA